MLLNARASLDLRSLPLHCVFWENTGVDRSETSPTKESSLNDIVAVTKRVKAADWCEYFQNRQTGAIKTIWRALGRVAEDQIVAAQIEGCSRPWSHLSVHTIRDVLN
jgi:hypothetical protein